jgi:hypothetical protein
MRGTWWRISLSLSQYNFASPKVQAPMGGGGDIRRSFGEIPIKIFSQILLPDLSRAPQVNHLQGNNLRLESAHYLHIPECLLICFVGPDGLCGYSLFVSRFQMTRSRCRGHIASFLLLCKRLYLLDFWFSLIMHLQ